LDRAQNVPGDFQKNTQFQQVFQGHQSERQQSPKMGRVGNRDCSYANVIEHVESYVEGENRKDFVLAANDEHYKQRNLSYEAKNAEESEQCL
jgi:hypothetical protein